MKTLKSWKLGSAFAGAILLGALATLPARAQTYPTIMQGQSPLDWWKFDETTPSPALDVISNSGSGGLAGTGYVLNATTGVPGGIVGNCVFFTNTGQGVGNCSSRIDIPNSPTFNPEPPFTVELWAKPNSPFAPTSDGTPPTGLSPLSSISVVGAASYEGARSGYVIYGTPGGWEFRLGGVESYSATALAAIPISTNSFTHVVGEFDGTTASIYINGVLAGTGPATGGPFQPNNFMPTRIGGTALPGGEFTDENGAVLFGTGNRGWDGWVSEVAVYATLLSSNTIAAHYTAGTTAPSTYNALVMASSPVAYWTLEDPAYTPPVTSYTLAADSGSLGDNGTNTFGSLADQPGVAGTGDKSVFYSGTSGSLVLDPSVTNLIGIGGEPISLVAWINPASFGYVSDIIAQGYDPANYSENFLRVGNSFDWSAFQDDSSGGNYNPAVVPDVDFYEVGAFTGGAPGYVSAVFPAPEGDIGHWVFLVGTYDGANWNLYRNGTLVAQFTDPLALGPAIVNYPWSVGSRYNPNQYFGMFFAGSIAEPAILTNALDAATISNLYNSATLPPVITQAPVAPSPAYVGSSATLSVWADGPGTLSYQWYDNNVAIGGQTATNLALTGLTAAADGTYSVVVTNAYGAATSAVALVVLPLPTLLLAPATETRWLGFPLSFAPVNLTSEEQFTFQWNLNGNPIGGATQSSYTAPASSGAAGSYTLVISNSIVVSTSSVATLSVLTTTNLYISTILGDEPLSYFPLDETNGTVAYDFAGGDNGTYFGNVTLGAPGFSTIDPVTAALFPGTAESYVGEFGATAINFSGTTSEFSIEAWANGPASQPASGIGFTGPAVVAKGHGANGDTANEQFAITVDGGVYSFFVRDSKANAASATATIGPDGFWHHLVGVCDEQGSTLTLYIDGAVAGTGSTSGLTTGGIINQQDPVSIGSESSEPGPSYDLAYDGTIAQVAFYPTDLSSQQVQAHYAAAFGPNQAPSITIQPVSVTNFVNYAATLSVQATGTVPLNYQWSQNGVPISGATTHTYAIASLASTDAGTYTVGVTNLLNGTTVAGILSDPATITVLQVPTNPPAIPGLVLHLTFDNTLADSSGRGNDATNEASGGLATNSNPYVQGQIGSGAFSYITSVDTNSFTNGGFTNAQYASLGVRPDFQFGSGSFTVSMWVALPTDYGLPPSAYQGNDLPFFTDTVGSTFGTGYVFAPSYGGPTADWPGGFAYSIYGTGGGLAYYGDKNIINDGNWHSLVYVIDRTAPTPTVYVDGVAAHQNVPPAAAESGISSVGNINVTTAATIGQDPTGLYPQQGSANIDDLGVWSRALTAVEAESIFLAGSVNQLSFTNGAAALTLSLQVLPGSKLDLTWSAGTLQATTNLSGTWTNVPGATSPYTNAPTGSQQFFRIKD